MIWSIFQKNMRNKEYKHLIFYDGECGFCDTAVQIILKRDLGRKFMFASLQGETAGKFTQKENFILKNFDSIVLIENFNSANYRIYIMSKAVFKICWLIKGSLILFGLLSFFPSYLFDWGYRFVARNRKRIFYQQCFIPTQDQKERFLS